MVVFKVADIAAVSSTLGAPGVVLLAHGSWSLEVSSTATIRVLLVALSSLLQSIHQESSSSFFLFRF
jgi:hypothetical protein